MDLFFGRLNFSGAIILFSILIEMWEKSCSFKPSPGSSQPLQGYSDSTLKQVTIISATNCIQWRTLNNIQVIWLLKNVDADHANVPYHSRIFWWILGKVLK